MGGTFDTRELEGVLIPGREFDTREGVLIPGRESHNREETTIFFAFFS